MSDLKSVDASSRDLLARGSRRLSEHSRSAVAAASRGATGVAVGTAVTMDAAAQREAKELKKLKQKRKSEDGGKGTTAQCAVCVVGCFVLSAHAPAWS